MNTIDFSDEYLTSLWKSINWKKAEEKLASLQEQLTLAAYKRQNNSFM